MRADIPLLADFIEIVPDAMAITEVDGNTRRINGPWLDLFGYGADDCIGQGLVMVLQPGAIPSMDLDAGLRAQAAAPGSGRPPKGRCPISG
jgi:PAS domain S-box-containing protein